MNDAEIPKAVHSVKWFKNRAKELLRAYNDNDADAYVRIRTIVHCWDDEVNLQRVQHVIAVEAGFECWKSLLSQKSCKISP